MRGSDIQNWVHEIQPLCYDIGKIATELSNFSDIDVLVLNNATGCYGVGIILFDISTLFFP